jgi:hypothetical protein
MRAISIRSTRSPAAVASAPTTAHSSAAEDDTPEPISTSLVIDIVPPRIRWPAPRSAHITPATYPAQPNTSPGPVSSGIRTSPSSRSLRTVISVPLSGT